MKTSTFLPALVETGLRAYAVARKHRNPVQHDVPPQWLVDEYLRFRPKYLHGNGTFIAELYKVERWRETGEMAGFYRQSVRTPLGSYYERYVWIYRRGDLMQVRQFGVKDVKRRDYVGRA